MEYSEISSAMPVFLSQLVVDNPESYGVCPNSTLASKELSIPYFLSITG
jgi:hypothetical protein